MMTNTEKLAASIYIAAHAETEKQALMRAVGSIANKGLRAAYGFGKGFMSPVNTMFHPIMSARYSGGLARHAGAATSLTAMSGGLAAGVQMAGMNPFINNKQTQNEIPPQRRPVQATAGPRPDGLTVKLPD